MLQRSIESYLAHTPAQRPIFADRGIPDTRCYARLIGIDNDESIQIACRRYRYAGLVFLAPPWREIYTTDSERKQDFAEVQRTFDVVADVYRELDYEIAELPKTSPAERAEYIRSKLPAAKIA